MPGHFTSGRMPGKPLFGRVDGIVVVVMQGLSGKQRTFQIDDAASALEDGIALLRSIYERLFYDLSDKFVFAAG